MRSVIIIIFVLNLNNLSSFGQGEKMDSIDHYSQLEERYQRLKDSLSISRVIVPAVSSVLLNNKQIEVNLFNSILSANKYRNDFGNLSDLNVRNTYFNSSLQFTYGLSKKARWNIGLDVFSSFGRIDNDINSSILKVFSSNVEGNSKYAKALTSISPRIRWKPFRRNYHYTIQGSVMLPIPMSTEKKDILGQNRTYILTQFLYNQPLTERLFLFAQLALQYGFKKGDMSSIFYPPLTGYLCYLLPEKTILFSLFNYIPIYSKKENWISDGFTLQIGAGLQYTISKNILIIGYYSKDIKGRNYQDFGSCNIGIRFITYNY